MGACASAVTAAMPKKQEEDPSKKSPAQMMKEVTKTLEGLINEMKKMGVTCFPAADLAMALPAYIWDLEQAKPFDYSKPTKKGVNPKANYSPNDQAMAILASLAYKDGAKGEIKDLLFNGSSKYSLIGKNAGAELAARGVTLSESSYAQLASYTSDKGKPCWFTVADETKKVVYVVIRGTQDAADVLSDLNIQTKDVTICGHAAKVHSGIDDAALFVIEESKTHIAPFLSKGFSLVFTGHSLGAGTAALAAAHSRSAGGEGYKDATAVTFACPGIITAKDGDGSKNAACKAMKKFVTTYILGYDVVPRATGAAVFKLLDDIFSNNWKEKTKKKMEEEAKKRMGAAAGMMGGAMSKMAAAVPPPTAEEKAAEEAKKKKVADEIAEGRDKISKYPHILPGGKLVHFVKDSDAPGCYVTKKNKFHAVILSAKEPGAFVNNHKMDQYLQFLGF